MPDEADRTPLGGRLEIEQDEPTRQTVAEFIRVELLPALQEVADDGAFYALALVAIRQDPDGKRALSWLHATADDGALIVDATLSTVGKLIRNSENRQVVKAAEKHLNRADRRRHENEEKR